MQDDVVRVRLRVLPVTDFVAAPLMPIALAATVGLCFDRYVGVTTLPALVVGLGLVLAAFLRNRIETRKALLALASCAVAAGYHHAYRNDFPADDIAQYLSERPSLIRLRGVLLDDPSFREQAVRTYGRPGTSRTESLLVETRERETWNGRTPCSGTVRVSIDVAAGDESAVLLRAGDDVELLGWIHRPAAPNNPGMVDRRERLKDQRIRAEMSLESPSTATKLHDAHWSVTTLPAMIRRYGNDAFADALADRQAATAQALILGDGSGLSQADWDAYIRTGVVHVLAISGQHFAIVAGCLWFGFRVLGIRRLHAAWLVIVLLGFYAVVTGLRPSAVRAFMMAACLCGSFLVRRPMNKANGFCAAWLLVILLNPADVFSLGCRLSFLSVFILIWLLGPLLESPPPTPLEKLVDESRTSFVRLLRRVVRFVLSAYLVSTVITLANAPLLIAEQNMLSPAAFLIGPILIAVTTVALIGGLLMLCLAPFGISILAAWPTEQSLRFADWVVHGADGWPGGVVTVPAPSVWWLIGFHVGLAVVVLFRIRLDLRLAAGTILFLSLPLLPRFFPSTSDEFRATVLAVGKGGCIVLETPDGRCLIYDAGSTVGTSAVRRVVAPYLLSRGIYRIDEVLISHADTDHFNGLEELVRRFPVGMVTLTPSFADKPTAEVESALQIIRTSGIGSRLAFAGRTYAAGEVTFQVLHPPVIGPAGTENERSLVLLVTHRGHRFLLTGDLEKSGAALVLKQQIGEVDVMTAPHHGSRSAVPRAMSAWCRPRMVVVSRGQASGNTMTTADTLPGCLLRDTFTHGAVTIRSGPSGLTAECFVDRERMVLRRD